MALLVCGVIDGAIGEDTAGAVSGAVGIVVPLTILMDGLRPSAMSQLPFLRLGVNSTV